MLRTRAVVDDIVAVTPPLRSDDRIRQAFRGCDTARQVGQLQINLVKARVGVGDRLPEREVRAMMLLRANVIAKGYSGARPELVDLLCRC